MNKYFFILAGAENKYKDVKFSNRNKTYGQTDFSPSFLYLYLYVYIQIAAKEFFD